METGPPRASTSRVRGLAAVTIAIIVPPLLLLGLVEAAALEWVPVTPWGVTCFVSAVYVLEVSLVVLLSRWLRRDGEWERTVHRWFGGRALAGLATGVALTLPIPLTMLAVDPGVFSLPDMDGLVIRCTSVTITPFAEEVLFRGFLFGVLWREVRLPPWAALSISSLLFGVAHVTEGGLLSLPGASSTVIHGTTGALLCWVYWRRGEDLWLPVGLHGGINLWPLFATWGADAEGISRSIGWTFSKIAVLLLVYAVIRWHEERRGTGSWIWTRSSPAESGGGSDADPGMGSIPVAGDGSG